MRKLLYFALPLILAGCSREFVEKIYDVNYEPTSRFAAHNLAPMPGQFEKDTDALDALMNSFTGDIEKKWGKDQVKVAGKSNYVKYIDNYDSRADVNFSTGKIVIETIASDDPKAHLKTAIITTLLTPDDPAHVDLFSSSNIKLKGEPFLYQQVVDQDNKAIQWNWRANRFADYLIAHKMKTKKVDFKIAHYVEIPMVSSHSNVRSYKYASIVRKASQRYDIPEDLIYAIIRTESSFNPYAVSWANAYGLMQVVPKTAGADVFKLVKKKSGMPSPEYLFNPENNIDVGTAYFHILRTRYLKDVKNFLSLEYAMISAYNGGTGGVLNTFDRNSRNNAMRHINSLNPSQVFWALTHKHPNAESRRYLEKVTKYKREFNQSKG
ncbi:MULTISPECIES: membrane-bound lytic murein transglycosylase MltC [Vibrio]|uniref:Membrane-bound lytic murein transglycosylase C n=1 Tax=Vibrio halioticoli NBRC 102217 TaxID=1219072 RepID=V5HNE1_9VIBR|nr:MULTISPECIES: membrane-bound lytic murein transglycosylase MltC [Vibrio]MPW34886.1 membrane-bound lytic murein transglycosylase MltC [Vibrio sp. B1Z05]GAD90745.1 membrane-bound lytic murein transglycosylase C [Vibrio halioticoli NBRC 102217]